MQAPIKAFIGTILVNIKSWLPRKPSDIYFFKLNLSSIILLLLPFCLNCTKAQNLPENSRFD